MSVTGPVLIIGTGLIGTSIGMALNSAGTPVWLSDADPMAVEAAEQLGAGHALVPREARENSPDWSEPALVVVCVPPMVASHVIAEALRTFSHATVTDVASVKSLPLRELVSVSRDTNRYIGSHPMAGREVSGPLGARGDLFADRLWVVTPRPENPPERVASVEALARACGAIVHHSDPTTHDHAVALTSHTPQVLSSVLAAQLKAASDDDVAISGQGLRDVTRLADSSTSLWSEILTANAAEVAPLLAAVERDVRSVRELLESTEGAPCVAGVKAILQQGRDGRGRLPDKHGGEAEKYVTVPVVVSDEPGELGRLFAAAGSAEINLEDVRIEHTVGRLQAIVELSVLPEVADRLRSIVADNGWQVRG